MIVLNPWGKNNGLEVAHLGIGKVTLGWGDPSVLTAYNVSGC